MTITAEQNALIQEFESIVGANKVLTTESKTSYYRSGFRSGIGTALAVVFPKTLLEQWKLIEACVKNNAIIIMQAAKTGLTEGSAPSGNDYDRDVVVISTLAINDIFLINEGKQAISLSGATLHSLEESLLKVNRSPHSVIGSSQLGATVIGGIANNSGGALVKRGPAYTEFAIYAQVDEKGELHLVNNLGIAGLGSTPEEILKNLQEGNFDPSLINYDSGIASDHEYEERVRDVKSDIPARFNADERRLFESSGCAGKLGVFAVRTDTFAIPKREQVFYLGTNNPDKLSKLRVDILSTFKNLPEMGEYMHRTIFNITEEYGKDTFVAIRYLGTKRMPLLYEIKSKAENFLKNFSFLPKDIPNKVMQYTSKLFPNQIPERLLKVRDKYEHHLILSMSDDGIEEAKAYLEENWSEDKEDSDGGYIICTKEEADKAILHRFAAGGAAGRYTVMNNDNIAGILPLDIALRRNDKNWVETLPQEVEDNIEITLHYGHFMCNVFHQNYIFKKGTDIARMKTIMLEFLDKKGAKYPAEHNVGHLYKAESTLQKFYAKLDPTNTFNPGIGKLSKYKQSCNCC
ncbi:MAG: D-lactate dehydrogenase [Campylobacterales bacterium]|nr:D-lactate dehydrogenase [Campylobacterales bacterium]NQY54006.1 D-lactate dehydrogenase [Campylobacteraceae bacterium]